MNQTQPSGVSGNRLQYLFSIVNRYKALLIVPIVLSTLLVGAYVLLKSNTWTAKQSLVIRDDLVGQSYKPGRFDSLDAMKVAQETILEIARKPQVIRNAMTELGAPPSIFGASSSWPSPELIEATQGAISISAPNGNEFGTTEIFLLSVKSNTPDRAVRFSELLLKEIEIRARELRASKFGSIENELHQKLNTAQAEFDRSARQLNDLEKKLGVDLSALRTLNLEQGGDGVLDQALVELSTEKRASQIKYEQAARELELLIKSRENPEKMLTTSSELLQMQPRLNDLVSGLSRAQLDLARQISEFSRSENHPKVRSGRLGILNIQKQIFTEIDSSIESLQVKVGGLKKNFNRLQDEELKTKKRLTKIAELRVDYDKLIREVEKREELLGIVRAELAQVQSASNSGANVNLLSTVDEPQVSTRPDGPSKKSVVGAGALGGLLIGMGLMMFVAPPFDPMSRPFTEHPSPVTPANAVATTLAAATANTFSKDASSAFDIQSVPQPTQVEPQLNPVVTRPAEPVVNRPVSQFNDPLRTTVDLRHQQIEKQQQLKQQELQQQSQSQSPIPAPAKPNSEPAIPQAVKPEPPKPAPTIPQAIKPEPSQTIPAPNVPLPAEPIQPSISQEQIEEQLARQLQLQKKQQMIEQLQALKNKSSDTTPIPADAKSVVPDAPRPVEIARSASSDGTKTEPIQPRSDAPTERTTTSTVSDPPPKQPPARTPDVTIQLPPETIDDEFSKFFNDDNSPLPE